MLDINPFAILERRINRLESLLVDINNKLTVPGGNAPSYPSDKKFDIKELKEYINTPINSIYGMVSRGEIPVSKVGRRLLFDKRKIDQWLEDNRKKTTAEIEAAADDFLVSKRKNR